MSLLSLSFHKNVMRLRFHSDFFFLFGWHFAISLDCCYYYLSLLWYCNGFHCQGQIAERDHNITYTYIYSKSLLLLFRLYFLIAFLNGDFDVVCRSVTTVSLFNSLDTNMKSTWNDTVWRWVSVIFFYSRQFSSLSTDLVYACQFEIFTAFIAKKKIDMKKGTHLMHAMCCFCMC